MIDIKTKFKETEIGTIPEEWDISNVGKLGRVVTGKTPPTSNLEFYGDGYLFVKIPDMTDSVYIIKTETKISEKGAEYLGKAKLPKNSIMVSCIATIGNVGITSKESFTNQQINTLIPDCNIADYRYLYYFFKNNKELLESLGGGGSVYTNISKSKFESMAVAVPELSEQKQIAEVLSSLDDKIELNRQINANLEKIASSLFKQWFVDFEFPNEKGKPYKSSDGKMIDSELGMIPNEWKVIPMAEFFDFLEGPGIRNWQYAQQGTRFINIRLIDGGDIDVNSANYINQTDVDEKYQHFLLKERDMVLSASGTLGKSAIVRKSHLPLLLNTSVIRFRPKDGISYPFLYQYLQSRYFLEEQVRLSAGSVQANFGPTHLNKMSVIVPNKKLLDNFNQVCGSLYDQMLLNFNKNEDLSKTRNSLLPRLMSGKMRIKPL